MDCRMPGFLSFTLCPSFLKYMSFESAMLSNYLILCCPLLLLPSIFPSIRIFSNELALCIRWPNYWSFSFNTIPSNEQSELISVRIDWQLTDWSPDSPRYSQEFSPTPQFKSINYLVLSLLQGPTLTSLHDYWENHSFDYMELCQKSDVFAF